MSLLANNFSLIHYHSNMSYSRRPARFTRPPEAMQDKTITQEQLDKLLEAAARVFKTKEQDTADKSYEVNTAAAGSANVKEETGIDNGVQLLAAAATRKKKRTRNN